MPYRSRLQSKETDELFEAVLSLEDREECYRFFEDLCTVAELHSLAQRLAVARLLDAEETYSVIMEKTGASSATISRVKKSLHYGADGYRRVLDKRRDGGAGEEPGSGD